MSASYGNVGPGGRASIGHPRQESVNSRRPSWLGQGTSDAAGKNLVPIKRPERGIQNDSHIGPFGPINAFAPPQTHNVSSANGKSSDIPKKDAPSASQPFGAAESQRTMPEGAGHTTTNFAPFEHQNPFTPPKEPFTYQDPFAPLKDHHGKTGDTTRPRDTAFDAVLDPSDPSKKDIIFKLRIPIEEDVQPGLEEFCRLRRLGRFEDAEQHFQETSKHLQGMPYVLVQYCEMLLAAGRYTSYRAVSYRKKYPSLESEDSVKHPRLDMLEGNFWLLDLLARVPQPSFDGDIFEAIKRILGKIELESAMGSTEAQILGLCLTILGDLERSSGESAMKGLKDYYFNHVFDWNQLYHRLLGENRIWDLRDLLVAAVSLFGTQFLCRCLNVKSFSLALDRLLQDWIQPEYDESTTLGLLDLFTSLLLDRPSSLNEDPKAVLLLEHSKSLAESVQASDSQNMRSRPFIQWIVAKVVSEMGDIPIRPDELRAADFSGITIFPGLGVHLPVYIPAEPWDKPHWDMFSVRSSPQQRQALQVALQAARFIGDYQLQAICLKLLILCSQEPKVLMDSLATLQLEQGDAEGFLETCLSKYIVLSSEDKASRRDLVADIEKLGTLLHDSSGDVQSGVYNSNSFCEPKASLLWARDVIIRILDENVDRDGGDKSFVKNNIEFWNDQLVKYGSKFPIPMANLVQKKYRVQMPQRIQDPIPPVPAQGPPPHEPSTVPWEPHYMPAPNPQVPQNGRFAIPTALGYPDYTLHPYMHRAGLASNPSLNPFAPPAARQTSQWQVNVPGPVFYHPPPPPPPEFDFPTQEIPVMNYDSEDARRLESKLGAKARPLTAEMLRKAARQKKRSDDHNSQQRHQGRRKTVHVDITSSDSSEIHDSEFNITSISDYPHRPNSIAGFYGDRHQKKIPEAPSLSESEDLSEQSSSYDLASEDPDLDPFEDDSSSAVPKDPELEGSDEGVGHKRTMSPDIRVNREGTKQNLNITSDLSEQHDISIVMTNKADATRSKVYTVKNGAISKGIVIDPADSDAPGIGGGEPLATVYEYPDPNVTPAFRPRAFSQSSLQTVRPLKTSILKKRPPPAAGPSTTINEEDESMVDDKSSTMNARVHKANMYMNRKTDKWLKDHSQDDNAAGSNSKPRRPSIVQPKPMRPTAPGSMVNAISTDEEDDPRDHRTHIGRRNEPRAPQQQRQPAPPNSSKRHRRHHTSEDTVDTGWGSNKAVQPTDSANSGTTESSYETTTSEEGSLTDKKAKRRRRPEAADRLLHRHRVGRDENERERLVSRLDGTRRARRPQEATTSTTTTTSTLEGKKPASFGAGDVGTAGQISKADKGKGIDMGGHEDHHQDGETHTAARKSSKAAGVEEKEDRIPGEEEEQPEESSRKAIVEEVTVEEVD